MSERIRREPVAEGFIATGPNPPGWYVRLPLVGLSPEQTRRLRNQALGLLDRFGESERAIIVNTFRSIVEGTEQRLKLRPSQPAAGLTPNVFLILVVPDETDPWAQIRDDRGTLIAFMLKLAEDADADIAAIWRGIAKDFDFLRFAGNA